MVKRALVNSLLLGAAAASLVPTAPGPGDRFAALSNCTIQWNPDLAGTWANVTIDLMSGSNANMSLVTNVVSGLDGTDASLTPFVWACPEVDVYSAIYFYQFRNGVDIATTQWTSRFTITSPSGKTAPPPESTQPDGQQIAWGVGQLQGSDLSSGDKDLPQTQPEDSDDETSAPAVASQTQAGSSTSMAKHTQLSTVTKAQQPPTSTRMIKTYTGTAAYTLALPPVASGLVSSPDTKISSAPRPTMDRSLHSVFCIWALIVGMAMLH